MPRYAAASPINIANVGVADANIHAGVKMLRNIADTYFNDPKLILSTARCSSLPATMPARPASPACASRPQKAGSILMSGSKTLN